MKPLNFDNSPCSPISSNCVIWQGPNLDCIKLCTGDTVSDVVASLATELCTVMDQLNISNYDLTCFDLVGCKPATFDAFLQFLIEQVCNLNNIVGGQSSNNPNQTKEDTLVTVAPCFVVNGITVMSLTNYVIAIGKRVCDLLDLIGNLQVQIDIIDNRVTVLEDAIPPSFLLPSIPTNCFATTLGVTSATIDLVLNALINDPLISYCELLASTGTPAELDAAVLAQCIENDSPSLANPGQDMQTAYGPYTGAGTWQNNPFTAADALNNLWIALCDIYTYVSTLTLTVQDTNTIDLDYTSGVLTANIVDTGWVDLNGFLWYGVNSATRVPQCRRIGNQVHFRGMVMIPLQEPPGNQPLEWDYKGSSPLTDTYFGNSTVTPSTTGPGSVVLTSGGSITFNQGLSVIPPSVVASALNFDNAYSMGFKIALRFIRIDTSPLYSGALTTLLKPIITSDKKLVLQLVKDFEESAGTGGTPFNPHSTSLLNNLISHVRDNQFVPKYQSASSVMASSPNSGTLDTITLPAPLAPDTQYVSNTKLDYDSTLRYEFDCDANDETNLGGFGFIDLDGLIAYLDPCNPDIKNYSCP